MRSFLDAWLEYCQKMSLADYSSETAMREHINQFSIQIVEQGFAGSVLDGKADVQALIVQSVGKDEIAPIPNAKA